MELHAVKHRSPSTGLHCTAACLVLSLLGIGGCHRGYYRRMADSDAVHLVRQKVVDRRLEDATGELDVDPASRMFDPFSRDHPPIPADDPESHKLMQCVDGRSGFPHWHANGDTGFVENPQWTAWLPRNAEGRVVIDVRSAVELGYLHSSDYQRQREELYLSALDVSLQRFGFDTQFFAGFNSFFETQGRFRGGGQSRSNLSGSLGANGGGLSLRRLGVTGSTFVIGIANSVLWNFSGPNTQTASSLINFSFVQPLLRGGGRDVVMESLTQAERTLLANVRQFERYRQGYHLQIVTGRSPGQGPSRGGGFLNPPAAATTSAAGLLGLLETQQQLRFAEFNVRQLENVLDQFREFFVRDRIDSLQVRQSENTLYDAQASLLTQRTNYQNQLDRFKQTLGLPPWLEVDVEDSLLEPFKLIGDSIQSQQFRIDELRKQAGDQLNRVNDLLPATPEALRDPGFRWPDQLDQEIQSLRRYVDAGLQAADTMLDTDRKELEADLQRLESERPDRLAYLKRLRERVRSGEIDAQVDMSLLADASIQDPAGLREQLGRTLQAVEKSRSALQELAGQIDRVAETRQQSDPEAFLGMVRENLLIEIPRQLTSISNLLIELSLTQALARSNSISLPEVSLDERTATAIARCLRLDWMNARASLVDAWRQVQITANLLESQFDLVLEGGIGSVGDNPFRIRYENGNLRGGFRFDTPLVRMAERNQYRQALIRFQQARRSYYQFEDEVSRNLRQLLRTIELNRILFELNRVNVQVAIQQVEAARFRLEEPARSTGGGGGLGGGSARTSSLGATTARDLTGAINQLQRAQTNFLSVWVDYETLRRNLDYDLGTFMLDPTGQWIDPETIDAELPWRFVAAMGLDPACLECEVLPEGIDGPLPMDLESETAPPPPTSGSWRSGGPASVPAQPAGERIGPRQPAGIGDSANPREKRRATG